jgi:chromate transporter
MSQGVISYREIAALFIKTGGSSFGGWSSTAVLLEKELVTRRKRLHSDDIKGAVAYAQIVPGATQVAIVAHAGYRLRGVGGAIIATIGYLLPAILLIILFAALYFHSLRNSPHLQQNLDGLIAALSGLILANAYKIGSKHASHRWLWVPVIAAGIAILLFHIHPLLVIVLFGIAGIAYTTAADRGDRQAGGAA